MAVRGAGEQVRPRCAGKWFSKILNTDEWHALSGQVPLGSHTATRLRHVGLNISELKWRLRQRDFVSVSAKP